MNGQLQGSFDLDTTSGEYKETQTHSSLKYIPCNINMTTNTLNKEFSCFDVEQQNPSNCLKCNICKQKYVKVKLSPCDHTGIIYIYIIFSDISSVACFNCIKLSFTDPAQWICLCPVVECRNPIIHATCKKVKQVYILYLYIL